VDTLISIRFTAQRPSQSSPQPSLDGPDSGQKRSEELAAAETLPHNGLAVVAAKVPKAAGFLYDCLVSETADPWFGGRSDAFFSSLEIPFPGNGDRSRQRLGSNGGYRAGSPSIW
jgi:hypothetical protein